MLPGYIHAIARFYQGIIEYFVPDSVRTNSEKEKQARMFLISHTIGPILGNTVPLALYVFDPTPDFSVIVLALSITGFWLFPSLLKRGVNYDLLVVTSVINLNFCILWSCYHYGGVASPTLPWLLIIPILSLFYIGGERRLQPLLLSISAGSFALFFALFIYTAPPQPDMPIEALQGLGIVSTIAALCYVATMAIYYSRIFNAGVDLENEVSRRMKVAQELRDAVATADGAASAKADFLASMSHELRTPLNAVIGYSDILLEDAIDVGDKAVETDVQHISDGAHYLLRLLNMILDLSKIEAGRMQFSRTEQSIDDIFRSVLEECSPSLKQNGNVAVVDNDLGNDPVTLDGERIRQILRMITRNASEHTKNGEIILSASITGEEGSQSLKLCVKDNGAGMDAEQLDAIFNALVSSKEASDSRYGGTGLSMTFAHKMCRAMGGSLTATSMPEHGSTFTVELPLESHSVSSPTTHIGLQNTELLAA